MKTTATGMMLVGLLWACAPVGAQDAAAPHDPWPGLTARSLLGDAENLQQSPKAVARAGRLAALTDALAGLNVRNADVSRLLCDVYQSQERWDAAAQAAESVLSLQPGDHAMGMRWLRCRLAAVQEADARLTFLNELLANQKVPAPLRAEGAVEVARIYAARGDTDRASASLATALELDTHCRSALLAQLEMIPEPSAGDVVAVLRKLLEANPRDLSAGPQLANELGGVGLHDQALAMLGYCWTVAAGPEPLDKMPLDVAARYISAQLDAGQADKAVQIFGGLLPQARIAPGFLSALAEAARDAGKDTVSAEALGMLETLCNQRMESVQVNIQAGQYADSAQAAQATAQAASALGWFYLLDSPQPSKALAFARKAADSATAGAARDLLLGAAQSVAGDPVVAARLLEPLTKDTPLASYFLADLQYRQKSPAARATLLAGLDGSRSGLPWRRLRELAKRQSVAIPDNPGAVEAVDALKGFDVAKLPGGLKPQDVLDVSLSAMQPAVALGDPIFVTVKITNTGAGPIAIGAGGLVSDVVGLSVAIEGRSGEQFPNVPAVILPAPRYLQPGRSVSGTARLDVGSIRRYLEQRPLESVPLQVQTLLSPRHAGQAIVSGLPTVKPAGVRIWRVGFLGEIQPGGASYDNIRADTYTRHLRDIEARLSGGTPAEQIRSARQLGQLIGWIRQIELQHDQPPVPLLQVADKRVLLGVLAQGVTVRQPVVRAELVASLDDADLDGSILNELSRLIEDPSPLVRLRVAELLGASGKAGKDNQMLRLFAQDESTMVKAMAEAFLREPSAPAKGS